MLGLLAALVSSGCAGTLSYYPHLAVGQLRLLAARRDVAEVVQDPQTSPALARDLARVEGYLAFARERLGLPIDGRYGSYVQLDRPAVVWNVFATPEFSVKPVTWRHPFIGAAIYRGYFNLERARDAARALTADGFDVQLQGAVAYSTLGWFDDPLLSTFIDWPDEHLAALLFHELAHGKLFVPGDSAFNEAFATFVGRQGVFEWAKAQGRDSEAGWTAFRAQADRVVFLLAWRERFAALYARPLADDQRRLLKTELFAAMRACHVLRGGMTLPARLNNAIFVGVATYERWTGAFAVLFNEAAGQWPAFFAQAKALGDLPAAERKRRLDALASRHAQGAATPTTHAALTCTNGHESEHTSIAVD